MGEKKKIKIGHLKITDHLVLGVSKYRADNGSSKLNTMDLRTMAYVGWNEISEAMCDGTLDGAFMLAPLAMDLFKSGEKIKLILLGHKNGSILIKNKTANIKTVEDFKGKIVIIPYQLSIHNMLFHKMLAEKGLSVGAGKDVSLETMAPSQIAEAIKLDDTGEIGGFIVAEPFGSQVVKAGLGEELALSKDIWPNHPCCVLVVKDDLINNNSDAVHELADSLVKSGQFIESNKKEASVIGASFLNQDVDVIEKVLTQPKDRITTHELMPVIDDLDKIQEYMITKMNAVKGKIDLEKFIDFTFAKSAGAK